MDKPLLCISDSIAAKELIPVTQSLFIPKKMVSYFPCAFPLRCKFLAKDLNKEKKKKQCLEQAVEQLSLRQITLHVGFINFLGKMFLGGFVFWHMHFFSISSRC